MKVKKLNIEEVQKVVESNKLPLRIPALDDLLVSVTFDELLRPKIEYIPETTKFDQHTVIKETKKVLNQMIEDMIKYNEI